MKLFDFVSFFLNLGVFESESVKTAKSLVM